MRSVNWWDTRYPVFSAAFGRFRCRVLKNAKLLRSFVRVWVLGVDGK